MNGILLRIAYLAVFCTVPVRCKTDIVKNVYSLLTRLGMSVVEHSVSHICLGENGPPLLWHVPRHDRSHRVHGCMFYAALLLA